MVTKDTTVYYIYDQADPWVAQTAARVRSKRQDERYSTSQRRRQTNWNLGVHKVMRAGHRQGGDVGGCSVGVV